MAHRYDKFDDAYAGLLNVWPTARNHYNKILTYKNTAWTHWAANEDHEAIGAIILALSEVYWTFQAYPYFINADPKQSPIVESIYWASQEGGAEDFTMASIIMAMYGATKQEFTDFIGIEDAYRQALWNMPFNRDYFAELARGFVEWE